MTKIILDSLNVAKKQFVLLDLVSDKLAWAKNRNGEFVFCNQLFCDYFGHKSMRTLIGRTDYDIAPSEMALRYLADDTLVLKGKIVTNKLELISNRSRTVEWFLTSKWPIYNTKDAIIGSIGISHHFNRVERTSISYDELNIPINYIHQYFSEHLSVEKLAKTCQISISALERRFKKHLGKTPQQYITEVRLEYAQRLLSETEKSVGAIALETGFADHSHFTRAFKKRFGQTPSSFQFLKNL